MVHQDGEGISCSLQAPRGVFSFTEINDAVGLDRSADRSGAADPVKAVLLCGLKREWFVEGACHLAVLRNADDDLCCAPRTGLVA